MPRPIIGRGTWLDRVAYRLVEREKRLGRSLDLILTESGIAASGIPHIGNLSDPARAYGVTLALRGLGYGSEMILFADDMDGLRSVPQGLPKELEEYILQPVSRVPDPYGCHSSYAEHMVSMMTEALDKIGIEYRLYSANEVYGSGRLAGIAEEILSNADRVGEAIKALVGQEKFTEQLPYYPVCDSCGRIYTAKAVEYDGAAGRVRYVCGDIEVKRRLHRGCGHMGWSSLKSGNGKLPWKVEFAARWKLLDIRFEAYGKDLIDSVKVNDWVSRNILGFEPPMHVKYEHFIDASRKKFSKSVGNVFTPQTWLRYGPPETLLLLMFKRSVGARIVTPELIPRLWDELEELEDVYFGRTKVSDERQRAKLRGLYEYIHLLKTPEKPRCHAPFQLLADIVEFAPPEKIGEFVAKRLQRYGYRVDEYLLEKAERVRDYLETFGGLQRGRALVELNEVERTAIESLLGRMSVASNGEEVQAAIFEEARRAGINPPDFFAKLYLILLGKPSGPRLGPYLFDIGPQRLRDALASSAA
ncbi:MAG: lysine--tRNA ligase [Nitrososphaerota archaeon]|nr:lysine--tRNA ligase [Candidatus Calditenuaceae archaeon]MDW8073776.1 lysine--tRNA ligase [Nitrososphaerota archaeon]